MRISDWSSDVCSSDLLREKGTPFMELGLDNTALTDAHLPDAVQGHPILMNRPFVVTPLGVRLCWPSAMVLDILPQTQLGPFTKEDGEVVIDRKSTRLNSSH